MMETPVLSKVRPARLSLRIKLLGMLILIIGSGFVWMAADHVIAPPLVRTMDLFWRLFVCRCFFQFVVF